MAENNGWEERLRGFARVASPTRDYIEPFEGEELRTSDLSRALAEIEALRREGKALVDALDACEPHITNAFQLGYTVRGATYTGPRYDKELEAFRARLEQKDQTNEG